MALQNAFEDLALDSTLARRNGVPGTPKLRAAAAYITSGSHTLITPPSGQKLRVLWVQALPSSDNNNANEIIVKFAGESDTIAMYRSYAISHWEPFEGAVDQALVVVTETAEKISVTVHYEVFS